MKTSQKNVVQKTLLALAVAGLSVPAMAASMDDRIASLEAQLTELKAGGSVQTKKGTTFAYGGFIKADASFTSGDEGTASSGGIFVPGAIKIGGESSKTSINTTAKYSRFNFKTNTATDAGNVMSYVELDFNGGDGSAVTNQGSSGIRHAFVSWDYSATGNVKVGQTWGTFFNVGALPETVDFVGPTAGTVFVRQNQVRWTSKLDGGGSLMLALEEPATTIDGATTNGGGAMPDMVARYNGKAGGLSYSAALMARDVTISDAGVTEQESEMGLGLSVSGKLAFDSGDSVKFMLSHGNLGRYQALGAFNEGWTDGAGDLELRTVTGGFVAYQHLWSDNLRSTFSYAATEGDEDSTYSAATDTESVSNVLANIMYSPTKKLTFGAEYMTGERKQIDGEKGSEDRFMVTTKYAF